MEQILQVVESIQRHHRQSPRDVEEISRLLAQLISDLREAIAREDSDRQQEIFHYQKGGPLQAA